MSCRVGRVERVKHAKTPEAIALTFTRSLAFHSPTRLTRVWRVTPPFVAGGRAIHRKSASNAQDAVQNTYSDSVATFPY